MSFAEIQVNSGTRDEVFATRNVNLRQKQEMTQRVVTIPCQYSHSCWFVLLSLQSPCILGLPSLRQLDLVKLHCAVHAEENNVQMNVGKFHGEYLIVKKCPTSDTSS
ncbi:hypothetical protein LSAT2_000508 [Lamellibrachia satsuma]|nr:hypothetical protein LSAT2_000508 [Lamellibrachia satsuma]